MSSFLGHKPSLITLTMAKTVFLSLPDDVVLKIFVKLDGDPRHWARLACVCTRFSSLVHHSCWKSKCYKLLPSLISDLPSDSTNFASLNKLAICCPGLLHTAFKRNLSPLQLHRIRNRMFPKMLGPHLAYDVWDLSRDQGSKLLWKEFRDDCLYMCVWPGCVHSDKNTKYYLLRGIFTNFKSTKLWGALNDGNREKHPMPCAFCRCRQTWELHSMYYLLGSPFIHDTEEGKPAVRAYVCEDGHLSGAWTHHAMSILNQLDE